MSSSAIGALRITLALDSANFEAGTKRVRSNANKTASSLKTAFAPLGNLLKGAVAGLAASVTVGAFIALAKGGLDYASSLAEVAEQLGVTVRDLQVFRYAGTQVGISTEQMDTALARFTRTLGEAQNGSKEAQDKFRSLGFTDRQIANFDQHDALMKTSDALKGIPVPAQQAARAADLFGRAGQKMLPFLSGGSAAINQLADAAERAGIVLSDQQIQQADKAADKLGDVKAVLQSRIAGVVADNAQAIYNLADAFSTAATAALKFISKMNEIGGLKDRTLGVIDSITSAGGFKMKGTNFQLRNRVANDLGLLNSDFGRKEEKPKKLGNKSLFTDDNGAGAKKAAADAKRAAREALQAEKDYQSRLGQVRSQILGAQADLTSSEIEKARLSAEQLEIERLDSNKDIELDEKLSAARKVVLTALNDNLYGLRQEGVAREASIRAAHDALDISTSTIANQRDILSAQSALTVTAKGRRDIELRLLDLQFQEEKIRLEGIIASKDATEAEKEIARQRLAMLGQLQSSQAEGVRRQTAGPMESYLNSIPKTADEIAEKLEAIKVQQLQGLEDGFGRIATEVLGVNGALGETLQMLLKIVAQQAILAMSPGGGGLGGFLGGLGKAFGFGGGGGGGFGTDFGGAFSTGWTPMKFATGGSFRVGGSGGIDSQLMQFRATPGEMVDVRKPGNENGGRVVRVEVVAGEMFGARVVEYATPIAQREGNRATSAAVQTIDRRARTTMGSRR